MRYRKRRILSTPRARLAFGKTYYQTGPPVVPHPANRPATVDRQSVTDGEYELAAQILIALDERAGTSHPSSDFIAKIVMRIREHPELTLDHDRV